MSINSRRIIGLLITSTLFFFSCDEPKFDSETMKINRERLKSSSSFQYPLDNFFPEIPLTETDPPKGEMHHTAEDSFAPAGTPVYAIGDGIVSYSDKAGGYGWLIIVDHPKENVYSLYGHLSPSRWKKETGKVKKGELIAYLAEAEAGETQVSHIHFGLRLGQRGDYPRFGDTRWTAGYTKSKPELHGWFRLSEIIGETDSMRNWHKYIEKREDILLGRTLHACDFKITSGNHSEKEDLDKIIENEFGDQYRMADWNEIMTFRSNIEDWADSIGLLSGEENSLMISNDGYRIWLGRQYYLSRFDNEKPEEFLAHDSIDDEHFCLGSWFGLNKKVLAVKK